MSGTALIAIDWGTTSARAYRIGDDGAPLEARSAPLGVQQLRDGNFAAALSTLLGDWQALRAPRLACGMIGSRQGWIEAPYLPCPAPFAELAAHLVRTPNAELAIVPGLTTRDAAAIPDVARGEETQLAGAVQHDEPPVLAVLPGTHSKWARVEAGCVVDFRTFMTGEIYAALLEHTILGRLADRAAAASESAFARGADRGLAEGELAHDVFGARTLALMGELAPGDVADWLSGLVIGREIRAARDWAVRAGHNAGRVRVIGTDLLVDRYRRALAQGGAIAEPGPPDAAARGLHRIAREAGILH